MTDSIKSKAFSGVFWTFLQGFGSRGIQFIVELIMARVLVPDDFGKIGMLAIFISISETLVDSGFSNALIQRQSKDSRDFSTVFVFNIVISGIIYALLFFTAPFISEFYDVEELTPITRLLSLGVIINSFTIINRAKLLISLDFKSIAIITMTASVIAGIIGISLVYNNFGVYSLVFYTLSTYLIQALLFSIKARWRPSFVFSKSSFRGLFSFGGNLLLANLLSNIYSNIYSIAIGKKYNSEELGYYTKAEQFTTFSISSIGIIFSKVTFPLLSSQGGSDNQLRDIYIKFIRVSSFLVFPIAFFLCFYARPLILFTLTEKWANTIIILQLLCLDCMWDPFCKLNTNLLLVKGYSKLILRLEIIKRVLSISILFITIPFGIIWICIGRVFYSYLAVLINTYYTGKIIPDLKLITQLKHVIPYFLCAMITGLLSYGICLFFGGNLLRLLVGLSIFLGSYLLCTHKMGISYLQMLLGEIKSRLS